jgi:catechol 2,3-dioxygenase-like lactoylglutathione lyase family enzyme
MEVTVKRVTGIGGVFFKARDAEALRAWYRDHLGIDVQPWGGAAFDRDESDTAATAWTIFPASTKYLDPSTAPFMINYRVADLDALLDALRQEGCAVDDKTDASEFGKFGWVMDPEGNRIELWEPPPA